jgi:hypothetical protein
VRADRLDPSDDFMTRHTGKDDAGELSLDGERVAMADAAGMDADQQFLRTGCRHIPLDALQFRPTLRHGHRNHLGHGIPPSWQNRMMVLDGDTSVAAAAKPKGASPCELTPLL